MPDRAGLRPAPSVDLWRIPLDLDEGRREHYTRLLSRQECARAGRYRRDIDRHRFIVRRGRLRELLGRELDCGARDVAITTNELGKPLVSDSNLFFSVSHSRGLAIFALTRSANVGCDVEWRDRNFARARAARLFLSPRECKSLLALSGDERTTGYFAYWTRKEAYLKATGTGLTVPADTVVVTGDSPARVIALPDDDPAAWSLVDLDLPAGYAGALAVRGSTPHIRVRS